MVVNQTRGQWFVAFARRAALPFLVAVAIGATMPLAMRAWVRVMQVSPSGLLAKVGFALGALGFVAALSHLFLSAVRVRRTRKAGLAAPVFSFWPFTAHIFCAYWVMIPTAVCLTLAPTAGPKASSWARNEDMIVQAAWNVVMGLHPN